MTYVNPENIVDQLYEATKKLYEELRKEAEKDSFDPKVALDKLKEFSKEIGEATENFLFNLCNSQELPQDGNSLEKLQEVQTWFRDTTIKLVSFQPSTKEQGIIPPFPRQKK